MSVSELPKYQSISNDLRQRIARDEFLTGERLPAQHALAEEYGVTVMTLRQAIAELETEGLVRAAKGKGTFVSEPPSVRYDLDHLSSFTQEMTHQGVDVATDVLSIEIDPSDADAVRAALGLANDVAMVALVRRRSTGGEALVLQRSVLAHSLWSEISTADFERRSLYDVLSEQCGIALDRASETIRAVSVDDDEAELLGVAPGSAALESIRVSRTLDDAAFLYDRALLRGEATEIRTERSAAGTRVAFQAL